MKPRGINDISSEEIQEILASEPVVLVGSGISIFYPTNLPSGIEFCEKMYEYIFFDNEFREDEFNWLHKEISGIPFEALMECYPYGEKLPKLISKIFNEKKYNCFHKLFAENLLNGNLKAIITPNYDLAFDSVLSELGYKNPIIVKDDVQKFNGDLEGIYFKIHGSVNEEDTLVYTLSQEGLLEKWKTDLLEKLLKNRTIVLICYSGKDFDICSFIGEKDIHKKILWIHYNGDSSEENEFTAYQEYLRKTNSKNEIIIGSIQEFTKAFFNQEPLWKRERNEFNPSSYFDLDQTEILEWRLNLLNRIACAEVGCALIEKLKGKIDEKKLTLIQCEMYGHTGEYKKEAREFLKLSQYYQNNSKEHILALIRTSEAWLKSGNLFKRRKYLKLALAAFNKSNLNDEELSIILLEQKFTLLNKMKQLFRSKMFFLIRRYIDNEMQNYITKIDFLRTSNLWDKRQTVQHILERLEVSKQVNLSLSSFIGYRNLGLSGMAIIAYRDKIRYEKWEDEERPLELLDDCLTKAEQLGMKTELWKYCRIKIKKVKTSSEKREIWKKWKDNLRTTEYGPIRYIYEKTYLYTYYFLN